MQTNVRPPYPYEDLQVNEFRVLQLQPGASDSALECNIERASITSPPAYEALSYCWGTGSRTDQLHYKTVAFAITPELSKALNRIRLPNDSRTLWIDQICINQENSKEKETQVPLMKQIYSKAESVLVWLGEEDAETDLAINVIHDVGEQIRQFTRASKNDSRVLEDAARTPDKLFQFTSSSGPEWIAYRKLLRRHWFTRLWTYQELVLSKQAFVVCGGHSVSWQAFSAVYVAISSVSSAVAGHESYLVDDSEIMKHLIFGKKLMLDKTRPEATGSNDVGIDTSHELLNLVRNLRVNQATDERDKIYAVFGVATDVDDQIPDMPPVDYTTHFRDVYAYFTHWFISRYQDLSVLKLVNILPELGSAGRFSCTELPSWVPDFRTR